MIHSILATGFKRHHDPQQCSTKPVRCSNWAEARFPIKWFDPMSWMALAELQTAKYKNLSSLETGCFHSYSVCCLVQLGFWIAVGHEINLTVSINEGMKWNEWRNEEREEIEWNGPHQWTRWKWIQMDMKESTSGLMDHGMKEWKTPVERLK